MKIQDDAAIFLVVYGSFCQRRLDLLAIRVLLLFRYLDSQFDKAAAEPKKYLIAAYHRCCNKFSPYTLAIYMKSVNVIRFNFRLVRRRQLPVIL